MNKTALLVIDIQNDYFPEGKFPLWNTDEILINIKELIAKANQQHVPVFLIQHLSSAPKGVAPFFEKGSKGANIHPEIMAICPNAEVIQKQYADSFYRTHLDKSLEKFNIDELFICGMMTQNCVTHTAISKKAERYKVSIIEDCCTTTDAMIHKIALNAASLRVPLATFTEVL
ncbi:cysteine hydrolase [Vibrio aestuarianus]|uniref:cysteine hydrolase family protein n=1 Tax=Vibrio aestuarianus TaxID=28171 RepID=UPI001558B064|nr:cysteine hydrolase family protein [Vibrio aestuarianus]MDE1225390.1 cysteine hydrolase [Vibrio aestuarianus]NGZ14133.1 cysteine hydrolase [Vibrio aestuarianus]NKZ50281.1 cysteine hydrolase [Vibrio aestuarianus]